MSTLRVRVKPNARCERLQQLDDGSWSASVKAPARDGKANAALTALVAAHFGLRKADVRIRAGASARMKLVELDD